MSKRAVSLRLACAFSGLVLATACVRSSAPVPRHPVGPSPAELAGRRQSEPLPPLAQAGDVAAFVSAAGAAPVSRREEIRARIQRVQADAAIAQGLIAEFRAAEKTDHSRALVILSLLGELRNPVGTAFLIDYVWKPLPTGGEIIAELGVSAEHEDMERLQVKAANAIAYARTEEASRTALELAGRHPSRAVRAEAASSYLWNQGGSDEARRLLSQYLRRDEQALLDRPVRDVGMSGEEFNRLLGLYLKRNPQLRPPAPQRTRKASGSERPS
jgi:hypothetical protein